MLEVVVLADVGIVNQWNGLAFVYVEFLEPMQKSIGAKTLNLLLANKQLLHSNQIVHCTIHKRIPILEYMLGRHLVVLGVDWQPHNQVVECLDSDPQLVNGDVVEVDAVSFCPIVYPLQFIVRKIVFIYSIHQVQGLL